MVDAGSRMYSGYAWASWYVTKMEGSLTCVNDAVDSRARRWRVDASMASTLAQHIVDGRVVELVLGHVAQVRRQRVLDALAELAGHDADQEDRLAALGVRRAVERIRTIRGVAGEVNALACVESISESGATERRQRNFDFYTGSCQRNSRASRRRSG